jgi:glucose-6-phosphate isomerase
VAALGGEAASRWVPLVSPEPMELELRPDDQLVFASKSGRTLELWTWIGRLRMSPGWGKWRTAPLVITQDDGNPLASWAHREGFRILPFPLDVGGRFSAFTAIGTLPLRWMGRDADAFLEGAREVLAQAGRGEGVWGTRVWETVRAFHEGFLSGVDQWVLLPYALRMEACGAWWVQLVAESLGKMAQDGVRRGLMPVRAVGPQDQHAQLQRWLDGPRNVGVVLVTANGAAPVDLSDLPPECPFPGLGRWNGAQILSAQAEGTRETLESAGVPVFHWHLEALDERALGAFLMAWQLIVGLTGFALEIDPFDQPAVEAGKRRTLVRLDLA